MKKKLYPGEAEVEREKDRVFRTVLYEEPMFVGGKPNWDRFTGWEVPKVLVWLNVD